jgi:hypothetical protein
VLVRLRFLSIEGMERGCGGDGGDGWGWKGVEGGCRVSVGVLGRERETALGSSS